MNEEAPAAVNVVQNEIADEIGQGRIREDSNVDVIVLSAQEWDAHRQRVEVVFGLVRSVLIGLSSHPMAAGLLPPDVLASLREME